jgi:hypothetical protein
MFFAAATALLACIILVACTLHSRTRIENDTVAIKDPSPVEADIIKAHMGDQPEDQPAQPAVQSVQSVQSASTNTASATTN